MKYKMPKFKWDSPNNKEEEKIVELIDDLIKAEKEFINRNLDVELEQLPLFKVIRDSSIGYTFRNLDLLTSYLANKDHVEQFVNECLDIIKCYADQIMEKYK